MAHFFEHHYLNANNDVSSYSESCGDGKTQNEHTGAEKPAQRKKAFVERIIEFYMNLIHKYSLSENLAKEITNDLLMMIQINQEYVKVKVMAILRKDQVNSETIEKIEKVFQHENNEIQDALDFINSFEE